MHDIDQPWTVGRGGQLIAPTLTNGVAMDAREQVTGSVVRARLPEISPGNYFAPQVRYGIDLESNDDGRMSGGCASRRRSTSPRAQPVLHALPQPGHSTPVRNLTGRLFLPLNFTVGWRPTEHTVISIEFGVPIIKDFPVYTFKTQLRVGYLF